MIINFGAPIRDIRGQTLKENDVPITLGLVCCNALLASYQDEQNLSGDEKVKRFRLAELIADEGEHDLKAEQVTLIKQLVGKALPPLFVGRVYDLIDPDVQAKANGGASARLNTPVSLAS